MEKWLLIEYKCEHCGHIKPKNISVFGFAFRWAANTIVALLVAIGLFFCLMSYEAMNSEPYGPNGFVTKIGGLMYTLAANHDNLEVREFLIKNVAGLDQCEMDKVCYADRIFEYMSNNTYYLTGAQIYPATYTLQNKDVQCSNNAFTFCYSLKQFNVPCEVRCGGRHCWNQLEIDNITYLYDTTAGLRLEGEFNASEYGE